ncbi:MAG: 2-oxoglutarate dehydrogenase, E2 component, dihydrolipoamide succinyltransferase [Rhodothermales bacterium]|nr:2-oxoglutarate dehydrogenase, E2 component, dihydrolipoamide succinyltransferase [Rhodothermales bacterium]
MTWHKQPGDEIEQDETLLEIGTDKVDTDVPAPDSGVLWEIVVEEGATVDVGTVIAVIETDAAVASSAVGPSEAGREAAQASESTTTTPSAPVEAAVAESVAEPAGAAGAGVSEVGDVVADAPSDTGSSVDVIMPKMGESIIEGTIIAWHKQPGDHVDADEVLLEIATDKVDTEVPSPAAGVVREILVPEGETVEVGTVIARIGGAAATPAATPGAPTVTEAPSQPAGGALEVGGDGSAAVNVDTSDRSIARKGADGRFFSPLVRSIAEKEGLTMAELESIGGSGHGGRLTKKDLVSYLEGRQAPPAPSAPAPTTQAPSISVPAAGAAAMAGQGRVEIIEMDRMRQIISQHMIDSKRTSAHVTSFAEVDVTGLVKLRESRKADFLQREGVKLTFTPFFVKAAVDALRDHPILNSSVDGTRIIVKKDIHVGIAVALGTTGLVVPVIRDAGGKNIAGLARSAATLADRARSKQLQPDDLQGGTFTVTNVGSLGSLMGTPIISQPQVAILATGAIKKRPVVLEDDQLGDVIAIRHMMYVSLSYDHRIVDGAMAASYLQRLIRELEAYDPESVI